MCDMKVKPSCFAYRIKLNKKKNDVEEYCDALTELNCEKCSFYKLKEKHKRDFTKRKRNQDPNYYADRIMRDIKYWEEQNKYN